MHDPAFEELAALAAIDAIDPAGQEDLRRHLADGCLTCRKDLESFRRVAADLALVVAATQPPARLRKKLASKVRPRPSRAARLALAAAVLIALTAGDDLRQRQRAALYRARSESMAASLDQARANLARRDLRARFFEDPDVQSLAMGGLGPQPGSRGKVYFNARARRAILLATNLAPLPAGLQYELWMIAAGRLFPAGTFDSGSSATVFGSAELPAAAGEARFAVTVEPRGGVALPTGPMVLLGPV